MSDDPRNTQFAGFAALLIPEIDEAIGAVVEWGVAQEDASEEDVARELKTRWLTLIAQRAYDLATHIYEHTLSANTPDPEVGLRYIPDLTQWPEE